MFKKLLAGILICSTAHGAYPPTTIQGQSDATATTKFNFQVPNNQYTDLGGIKSLIETGNNNLLKNPGFEASTYSTSWTITNSTGAVDTTNEVQGLQGAALTLSAQTGDIIRQSVAPSNNLESQNFEASCRIKTSLTSVQLCGLVSNTEQTCQTVSPNNVSGLVTANFISTGGGATVGVKVKATSTETGTIYVDDCYVGQARNIGTIAQAAKIGTIKYSVAALCAWTTTSTTYASFAADTDCGTPTVTGIASAPSTKIPAIKFSTLPAGSYMFISTGNFQATTASTTAVAAYRFSDGTNTFAQQRFGAGAAGNLVRADAMVVAGTVDYSSPQSNITIEIQALQSSSTDARIAVTSSDFEIDVYYFPNSAQQAYNANQLPASWSGYHDINCGWNRASTTYANYGEDNSCTFTERTNRNFGSVTSDIVTTGRIPRIMFVPNKAGMYQVCASFAASSATTSSATGYKMVDASANELLTKINYTAVSGNPNILQMCSIINATSTSQYTVNIQGQAAGVATNYINQNANSTVDWTILSLDNTFPAPVLTNMVQSSNTSVERVERLKITPSCTSTPCTITSQSGNFASSVTRASSGNYTVNFTTAFSAAPNCVVQLMNGATSVGFVGSAAPTTTAFNFGMFNSGSTATDLPFQLICVGPK